MLATAGYWRTPGLIEIAALMLSNFGIFKRPDKQGSPQLDCICSL